MVIYNLAMLLGSGMYDNIQSSVRGDDQFKCNNDDCGNKLIGHCTTTLWERSFQAVLMNAIASVTNGGDGTRNRAISKGLRITLISFRRCQGWIGLSHFKFVDAWIQG
jgi:hypothetical protein